MTLRDLLSNEINIRSVDYTRYYPDGTEEYDYLSVDQIPNDIMDLEIINPNVGDCLEYIESDDEVIAYVDLR